MKVPNSTIEAILGGSLKAIEEPAAIVLIQALAADLKEAREVRVKVVREATPAIAADVKERTRVEGRDQLRMLIPEPFAGLIEERARAISPDTYPLYLVPRNGVWLLQLERYGEPGAMTAVRRGRTMDDLNRFVAKHRDGDAFRAGSPLEGYRPPHAPECFVNILESIDTYLASAIAGVASTDAT